MKRIEDVFTWDTDEETGCWNCTSHGKDSDGYSRIYFDGSTKGAHRVAWAIENGDIPDGKLIRHKCDNRACINPGHLELGTASDNMADRHNRGRDASGEDNGFSKVTKADVIYIMSNRNKTSEEIAKVIGVSKSTVARIRTGETWSDTIHELGLSHLIKSSRKRNKISYETVLNIRKDTHLTLRNCATKHGVSIATVSLIRNRKVRTNIA